MIDSEPHELATRHSLALEAGKIGLWTWDATTNVIDWDERTRAFLGNWPDIITPDAFNAAVHPDDLQQKLKLWAGSLDPEGDGTYRAEYRLIRPGSGEIRWISSSGRTIFKDRKPVRMVGVMLDVTERQKAEAERQQAMALMSGIVSIAADAIISIDLQHNITLFNKGAEAIFGYRSNEVIGKPLSTLLPERFQAAHSRHVKAFGAGNTESRHMGERSEILGRKKSGETFIAEASISKLEIGGVKLFTAVLRDVSERHEVARQLQKSKEFLEIALTAGQIGLFEHDHISETLFWSPILRTIFGIDDRVTPTFNAYLAMIPEEERPAIVDAITKAGDPHGDGIFHAEHRIRRPDGNIRWIAVRANTFSRDGARERTVGSILDITDRRQSQAVLEDRVEASTRELKLEMRRREQSQAQLVRTQRMEAFGQLTGGIAHDFNNLLTIIMGNLELVEMRLKDDKTAALLKRAQDAVEMGARLTGRLLTFARRRQFMPDALNLNEHVLGMAELLERTLGEPVTLTTVLERAPWTVMADASEIENAILNLAINARDAMPLGGRLIIETANVSISGNEMGGDIKLAPGDYVRLSMSDTGTGMTPETLQRAIEPFFTTKEPGKGTGLGLSTIYGFVRQANGNVTIYSEPGLGTTVNIYLPRVIENADAAAALPTANAAPARLSARVLLVEDNPDVRKVTRSQLEILGCNVEEVVDGPSAVRCLEADSDFDIVLSDVVMAGGMSGFDVARWIAENRPALKVMLASGYPDDVLRNQNHDGGSLEILRKPYSRAALADALRRVLDT